MTIIDNNKQQQQRTTNNTQQTTTFSKRATVWPVAPMIAMKCAWG
jgi:hypothetical protein